MGSFEKMNKPVLKSIWKSKEPRIVKTLLKKNSKAGRLTLPELKTYHKAIWLKAIDQDGVGLA